MATSDGGAIFEAQGIADLEGGSEVVVERSTILWRERELQRL